MTRWLNAGRMWGWGWRRWWVVLPGGWWGGRTRGRWNSWCWTGEPDLNPNLFQTSPHWAPRLPRLPSNCFPAALAGLCRTMETPSWHLHRVPVVKPKPLVIKPTCALEKQQVKLYWVSKGLRIICVQTLALVYVCSCPVPLKTPSPRGSLPSTVEFLAGVVRPLETPPKDPEPREHHAHALVEKDGRGFVCVVCSAVAGDEATLSMVPCVAPPAMFAHKRLESMNLRIQEEQEKLEKLRKLRLHELEYQKLADLKRERDQALKKMVTLPKPAPGLAFRFLQVQHTSTIL